MTEQALKEAKDGVFSNADIPLVKTALLSHAQPLESDHLGMRKISLLVHLLGKRVA